MATSRPDRSTRSRSSPAAPSRQTHTPLIATSSCVGLERRVGGADGGQHPAPVGVLAVDRALEQVAAGDRAADLDGVVLGRGADDLDRDVLGRALGVGDQLARQVGADAVRPPRRGLGVGRRRRTRRWPAAARCRWWTCSRRSRPGRRSRGSRRAARRRASAASATASVVRTTSIVASPGASMPAPLAMPPTVKPSPSTTRVLAHGVGGHDRLGRVGAAVGGQRGRRRRRRRRAAGPSAAARRSGRSSRPRPRPRRRRAPRRRARRWRGCPAKPAGPVQALAPPELRTTAREPAVRERPARDHSTGAALTRLLVKTPAAASSGPSLTTSATSGPPLAFSPAATPAARKPCGGGDAHGATPSARQAGRLGQAEHRGWRTARPGRPRPCRGCRWRATTTARPASTSTATCRWHAVGAERGRRCAATPLGQHVHERLVGVRRRAAPPAASSRRSPAGQPGGAGGEDAARHRREHRRERQRHAGRRRGQRCSISGVCWWAPPTLYGDRSPITSLPSRCAFGDRPAPRRAGRGDDDDVVGLDQARGEQRGERQDRSRSA